MNRVVEFGVGVLFGLGLIVSGLSDPSKVLGFLDLFGAWDPSLMLVMGGAVAVGSVAFAIARKRETAYLGGPMQLPTNREIDRRLVLGSLVFGLGWGLVGFCPGPALVAMGAGQPKGIVFVVAMIAGMLVYEIAERLIAARPVRSESAR